MDMENIFADCLDQYEQSVVNVVKNNYKNDEKCKDIETRMVGLLMSSIAYNFYDIKDAFYEETKSKNWQRVNDFLYQDMLRHLMPGGFHGYDHCYYFHWALSAYACGAEYVIERIFPHELGLSTYGYPYLMAGTNLIMAMYYKDEKMLEQAIEGAAHFVNKKTTKKWERTVIQFILDILHKDVDAANKNLQEVCKGYMRCNDYYLIYSMEDVCVPAYGIYFLAQSYLSKDEFAKLEMPEHKTVDREYVQWRLDNPIPDLKPYVIYPKEMDVLNKLYSLPVAKVTLMEHQASQFTPLRMVEDVEKRYWNFVEELKQL